MTELEKLEAKFETFTQYDYSEEEIEKIFSQEEIIRAKLNTELLEKYKDDVSLFYRMLKDSFIGKYREIPRESVATIVCTLLYLNAPVDAMPDFIPKVGFSDDAALLGMCQRYVAKDVDRYKTFIHLNREIKCNKENKNYSE